MTSAERIGLYLEAFSFSGGDAVIGRAQIDYIVEAITDTFSASELPTHDLREIAQNLESLGVEAIRSNVSERNLVSLFDKAFQLRASLRATGEPLDLADLWMLIASGVASENQPQLREILSEIDWTASFGAAPDGWAEKVLWQSSQALFYLVRKQNGWADIDAGLLALYELVELQGQFQGREERDSQLEEYEVLVGLYHLAEGLSTLGEYLRTGLPESVLTSVERNTEHARYLLGKSSDEALAMIGTASSLILPYLVRSSIWFNTSRLSEAARQFARRLADQDHESPVLELWWAQREALAQNLLDPFKVAIGVQMPTSAGKTLLAEFSIVQTLALNPSSTVAYIVPTRALVNQVTRRLRLDLQARGSGVEGTTVEAAVPVFELDPTEDAMLSNRPDVLVTTPEKLDLLVRSGHAAVRNLALVVVDEAHHIAEPSRGPRLELLLATLKRERGTSCRYLLLTPFLPNADELARWLGGADYAAISLDWRPSLQVRALAHWTRRSKKYYDTLQLVPSVTQPKEWEGVEIDLGESFTQPQSRSRPGISASTAVSLSLRGASTLILTQGQKTSEDRAAQVVKILRDNGAQSSTDEVVNDVVRYISDELGSNYPLVASLPFGVAFHHAGLPPEIRNLVEQLLARGSVQIVTGTSTLAQGVNFPLASVIVETLRVRQGIGRPTRALQYSEFWNIAGRAGRALKDRVGTVIWPSNNAQSDREFRAYLEDEAAQVVSALTEVLSSIGDVPDEYSLRMVRDEPALTHFLQYLAHALRVGGFAQATAEIEDILRSSLVFYRMRQTNRDAAEELVRWSRQFMEANRNRGLLDVADATGLSLPSVGLLAGTAPSEMRDPEFWLPDNLFGSDLDSLTSTVELLAEVPEFSLGLSDEQGGLNARRVAGVLRDWVSGATLPDLVREWTPDVDGAEGLRRMGRYLFGSMTGQLPWGLGALQLVTMADAGDSAVSPDARRVPAMAYYGVKSTGAIAMRMIGVPRSAAERLGLEAPRFESFNDARVWAQERPDSDWAEVDRGDGLLMRRIWNMTES
jgi:helicase